MTRSGKRKEMTLWKPYLKSRYGDRCYICGQGDYAALTVDHVVPVCEGGEDSLANLRLCCCLCNMYKSKIETYMKDLRYRKPELLPSPKQLAGIQEAIHYFRLIVARRKAMYDSRNAIDTVQYLQSYRRIF